MAFNPKLSCKALYLTYLGKSWIRLSNMSKKCVTNSRSDVTLQIEKMLLVVSISYCQGFDKQYFLDVLENSTEKHLQ